MFRSKILAFSGLILILLAIPLTIYLARQQQELRQRASPSSPAFNVGLNISGITHYGYNDLFPYAPAEHVDADLQEAQKMGVKIMRVFAANNNISDVDAARRLEVFLQKANQYGISIIVSLIDFYSSGFNPQGTDQYYTDIWNGIPLLNHQFFLTGYQSRYKDFVKVVVNNNKNYNNIYAWEVGNELKDNDSPETFVNFMADMTNFIKTLDSAHPVATGLLNAGHAGLTPANLYSRLPSLDIITVHTYNGDRSGVVDVEWAVANNKKALIEEAGFSGTGDRTNNLKTQIDFWKNKGATAFLQWGFIAKNLADNGNGDRDLGMDNIWHTDYEELSLLFTSFNQDQVDICIQMITPARNPKSGECKEFPTPCDVPPSWEKVDSCENNLPCPTPPKCQNLIIGDPNPQGMGASRCPQYTCLDEGLSPTQKLAPTVPVVYEIDVNQDKEVNIFDYNFILSCLEEKASSSSCVNKNVADLNKDGVIDIKDLNILIFKFTHRTP